MLISFFKCKNCQKFFCNDCSKANFEKENYCPNCENKKGILEAKKANMNLDSLFVYCENFSNGCTESIPFKDLFFHQTYNCNYRKYTCQRCEKSDILIKDIEIHDSQCECRRVICPQCQKIIIFKELLFHQKNECFNVLSACVYCESHIINLNLLNHLKFCQAHFMRKKVNQKCKTNNKILMDSLLKIFNLLNNNILGLRANKDDHKLILDSLEKANSILEYLHNNKNLKSEEIKNIFFNCFNEILPTFSESNRIIINELQLNNGNLNKFEENVVLLNQKEMQEITAMFNNLYNQINEIILKFDKDSTLLSNEFKLLNSFKLELHNQVIANQNQLMNINKELRLFFSEEINELKRMINSRNEDKNEFNLTNLKKDTLQLKETILKESIPSIKELKIESNQIFNNSLEHKNELLKIKNSFSKIELNVKQSTEEITNFRKELLKLNYLKDKNRSYEEVIEQAITRTQYEITKTFNSVIKNEDSLILERIDNIKHIFEEFKIVPKETNKIEPLLTKIARPESNLNLSNESQNQLLPTKKLNSSNSIINPQGFLNFEFNKLKPDMQSRDSLIEIASNSLNRLGSTNKSQIQVLGQYFFDKNLHSTQSELLKNKYLYYLQITYSLIGNIEMILHVKALQSGVHFCIPLYNNVSGINAVTLNNFIICGGGHDGNNYLNTCAVINLETKIVDYSYRLNERKSRFSLQTTSSNLIYSLGGEFDYNALSTCEVLDFQRSNWKITCSLNECNRRISSVFIPSNFIYCFGGSENIVIEKLNISFINSKWEKIDAVSASRHWGITFLLNENEVLIFGGSHEDNNFYYVFNVKSLEMTMLNKRFQLGFNFNFSKPCFFNDSISIISIDPEPFLFMVNINNLEYKKLPVDF